MSAPVFVPWYREPLAYLVLGIPVLAVVVGMVMLAVSMYDFDGLVVDDYYKRGKEINRVLARDETARRLGLSGRLRSDSNTLSLVLARGSDGGSADPEPIVTVRFLHATRSGQDREIEMRIDGVTRDVTRYRGARPELGPGKWYVQAETDPWRLRGVVHGLRTLSVDLTAVD